MKMLDAVTSADSAICMQDTARSALTGAPAHYAARISPLETKLLLSMKAMTDLRTLVSEMEKTRSVLCRIDHFYRNFDRFTAFLCATEHSAGIGFIAYGSIT
jgi:hypothetical protein